MPRTISLSELLREIGDENLQFQVLNADMERTNVNTRDAQIVFRTARENALAIWKWKEARLRGVDG